ncbi:MAG: NAD-dependent epimerase/dehydratase family protein [Opitutales bacterium]|nr:NAD-dependent epimerase/dehydratase family protein [Opitutales bacterium]
MQKKILVTGSSGLIGSEVCVFFAAHGYAVHGVDNNQRAGFFGLRGDTRWNQKRLEQNLRGFTHHERDIRDREGILRLIREVRPDVIVHTAAIPFDDFDTNAVGSLNLPEYCRRARAGFILLSTSRVYHITALAEMPVEAVSGAFQPTAFPAGVSAEGVSESYSTAAPVSLYGASKVASEVLALEYGATYNLPVWINRCGVLAGAGQFGRPDQGIFSYWLHSWKQQRPLKYIGFDGQGHQVRDCLHPDDLANLLLRQLRETGDSTKPRIVNVSGGRAGSRSLRQVSDWCRERWGGQRVSSEPEPRRFDIPWMVLDSRLAQKTWGWTPTRSSESIFEEIARHAEADPAWLDTSAPL